VARLRAGRPVFDSQQG